MLKLFIHNVLKKRHFWRHADFDELSEVYIAMAFRGFALGMIGIFVPVYILKLGFGLSSLLLFFTCYFAIRIFTDFIAAYFTARYGPKHTLLMGYVFQICAAGSFTLIESGQFSLYLSALIWGAAASFTFIALHVDFSKIKHSDHGGKELGFLNVLERAGGMIGPIIGGVLATFFGAQVLFFVAAIVLFLGLIPLFSTVEPVKVNQKLHYKKLKLKPIKHDIISSVFYYVENTLCVVLWPAFLTLFVFLDDNIYGTIGALASVGFMVSIASAYAAGKIVDTKKGGALLRFASLGNAVIYLIRPFVQNVVGVLGINIINDSLTVGYRIPFTKGLYDAADQHPGLRIVYLSSIEGIGSLTKGIVWFQLYVLSLFITNYQLLVVGFIVAAICSVMINTQRFTALKG